MAHELHAAKLHAKTTTKAADTAQAGTATRGATGCIYRSLRSRAGRLVVALVVALLGMAGSSASALTMSTFGVDSDVQLIEWEGVRDLTVSIEDLSIFSGSVSLLEGSSDLQLVSGGTAGRVLLGDTSSGLVIGGSISFSGSVFVLSPSTRIWSSGSLTAWNGGSILAVGGEPPIPEPSAAVLFGVGVLGLSLVLRRR